MALPETLSYRTLRREGIAELVIQKSRFVGYAAPALAEEDALAYIEGLHRRHPDASCICHGYISGMHGQVQRFYDGHEPVGGMPILECLKKQGLTGAACAVVRWFGGVKLGAGGLARAFGQAAALAVEQAEPCLYEKSLRCEIAFPYSFQGKMEYFFANAAYRVEHTAFGAEVVYTVLLHHAWKDKLAREMLDLTHGVVRIAWLDETYQSWDEAK